MSRTYVCFDCRTTERVERRITRNCRLCRRPAEHVYWKFRIPKKDDDEGWDELRKRVREVNDSIKKRALEWQQVREARWARILATARDPRRRRELERRLRAIRATIAEWERWR